MDIDVGLLRSRMALALSAFVAVLAAHHLLVRKRKQRLPLPPGPPARLLLGNLFDLPTGPEEWKKFAELGKKYGPVMYLGVLDRSIVVLSSFKAASDLLDKRSAIYSDRARFPMVGELMGFDFKLLADAHEGQAKTDGSEAPKQSRIYDSPRLSTNRASMHRLMNLGSARSDLARNAGTKLRAHLITKVQTQHSSSLIKSSHPLANAHNTPQPSENHNKHRIGPRKEKQR